MIQYTIVQNPNAETFSRIVQRLLNEGWKCKGKLIVTPEDQYHKRGYTREMYKLGDRNSKKSDE